MFPEVLEAPNIRELPDEESLEKRLGNVFAESVSKFYFLHAPPGARQEMHDTIMQSFSGGEVGDLEVSITFAAGVWEEGFLISSRENVRLFNPKASVVYPPLTTPKKAFDSLAKRGFKIIDDPEKFETFCSWYRELEDSLT